MQKAVSRIAAVLGRVIFIGLSIQIVLGMIWMCLNFASLQAFGESAFYVQISKNFICDEYTGILYPVFLLLARGVGKLIRLPYYCVIYAVQLLIACYGAHRFLAKLRQTKKAENVWGSLAVLTLPMAMQCHLAVLPYSLAGSFFLLELSFSLDAIRSREILTAHRLMRIMPFWLLCALLLPEYLYIGALPAVLVLCHGFFRGARGGNNSVRNALKQVAASGIVIAAFAGIIVGMNGLTQVKGYYGRGQRSVEASFVSRFAWSGLMEEYEDWPEEMRGAVDRGKLMESAFYPDNMGRVFGPLIEEAVGEERAGEFYLELSKNAWKKNRAGILHEIAWDAASYAVSPIALQMQLTGRGYDSFSGRNYEIMRQKSPVLSRIYMNYGCWWFAAGLGVAALLQLLCFCFVKGLLSRKNILSVLLLLLTCAGMIFWYTMRGAGIMDYKNTIVINYLWTIWSLLLMQTGWGQES